MSDNAVDSLMIASCGMQSPFARDADLSLSSTQSKCRARRDVNSERGIFAAVLSSRRINHVARSCHDSVMIFFATRFAIDATIDRSWISI
jgi:hypothetical protein